jgi:gamma-glutamyltranspeptidase/glutathione hydrolase
VVALGSPGGGTIVTTVLGVLVNVLDFDMDLESAVAAPRIFQDSTARAFAEPEFLGSAEARTLEALGHRFVRTGALGLGAVAAIAFDADGTVTAAAEPARRGGGSALVERPR